MTERRDERLDETLSTGRRSSDPELDALTEQAERLREELSVPPPAARRQRTLFVQGAAGRSRSFNAFRFLAPAAIVVAGIVALAGFGRTALPGQTLWPVREALSTVGLAATPEEEIDRRIDLARAQCREAADLEISHPLQAQDLVLGAIGDLERARALAEELDRDQRSTYLLAIGEIEDWAIEMIVETEEIAPVDEESPGEDDDNSGPGGDDSDGDGNSGPGGGDSGDDDNSGPGGGGDDNSGPGDGDDSGDDDNSGSGSDGSGGDDSSGSGSGDSGGDDSSGSGGGDDSGSSGSGSGDSSGSGGGGSSGSGSGDDD